MRIAALLIVLYFASSIAKADFFGVDLKPPTAADASAAGKKAQQDSIKLVEGNIQRDGQRSRTAIGNSTISINPGGVSGLDNFSIQAKDLQEVKDGIQKQYDKCTAIADKAIAAAEIALAAANDMECEKKTSTDSNGNSTTTEDCTKKNAAIDKATKELAAAKKAKKEDCQDPLNLLMEKVGAMKVQAEDAARQARKVKDASQGFGGGSGGGGGGREPKPGEVTVECLKGVAYMNPACTEFFKKYCASTPDEPVCANWAGHYCGFDFAAGSPRPHADDVSCIIGTPYYFCNGALKEERKNCQSCKDLKTIIESKKQPYYSTEVLVANREACPDDPILKQPEIIERLNAYDNATPSTGLENQSFKSQSFKTQSIKAPAAKPAPKNK